MLDDAYRKAQNRVATLASTLDPDQLTVQVPATPEWTVHDLLAHLVGGAADLASGRIDGAPGTVWTARHVGERRRQSVEALLAEWQRVAPTVEASLVGQQFTGPSLAADLICHEGDLHEALGLAPVDRRHWKQPFLDVMMLLLGQRLRKARPLLIRDECSQQWHCGAGEPTMRLEVDSYELLRAMFSRRSRRQISEWNWTVRPSGEVIDSFGVFGPRDDDQPFSAPHQTTTN